jgi:REP-associated tyrosine transposase
MARQPRIVVPGLPYHVTHRGNDGAPTFFGPQNYESYLRLLELAAQRYGTVVHAYVLMTNHVHLLLTPREPNSLSRTLQYVASIYSGHINERFGRTGTLWGPRFRSTPIDADEYCLACYRYIELNPVRAGIASAPSDYRWSSYRINGLGEISTLVVPHPTYLALGGSVATRREAYRNLFQHGLSAITLDRIRRGTRRGLPTGAAGFRDKLERTTEPESGSDPLL